MKRKTLVLLYFLVSLGFVSCSKLEGVFCVGDPVDQERTPNASFHFISMHDNINVTLEQSSRPRLELTCPENLIDKMVTEVIDDTLFIRNENTLEWLHDLDYDCHLTVFYDSLQEVRFYSKGYLRCNNPIHGMGTFESATMTIDTVTNDTLYTPVKSFYLKICEGSGDIDLVFDCDVMKTFYHHGTSDVRLSGRAGYSEHIAEAYGPIHAEELNSNFVRATNSSTNNIYVSFRTGLRVWISSIGKIYFRGPKQNISVEEGDEQQVIELP